MSLTPVNGTTLTTLTGNLDIDDVADPALRLAYFQYVNAFLTNLISELSSTTAGTSGAHQIGSALISGVSGLNVNAQMSDLKTQINNIIAGIIVPSSITTAMIQDLAITFAKLAPTVKTGNRGGKLYTYRNQGGF